ncbi:Metallo-peptidase family M12-domain-containing protein [Parasitella parasitica]|nr:Metallo-peptidase family M12-domain-containing protein [Parasitella parasitica]
MHFYIHCVTIFDTRIESISNLNVQIAPRSRTFFEKRSQSANPERQSKKLEHDDSIRLSLNAYNQTFYLHLEPNLDLFHPEAVVHHNGETTSQRIQRQDILVYKGHVVQSFDMDNRWIQEKAGILQFNSEATKLGWARILIRHDLMHKTDQPIIEGAFKIKNDIYHIKSTANYNLVKRSVDIAALHSDMMVIYRDSDTQQQPQQQQIVASKSHGCGFDNLLHRSLVKRGDEQLQSNNGFTKLTGQGCPTTKKINYMGAAADCTYVQYYKSVDNAKTQIINNFNMASAVFEETFNISLGLINITIMDRSCPAQIDKNVDWNRACNGSYSLGDRLSDFSLWRSKMSNDGAGLWHLMTNCATGVEVGLAWLKQLCNTDAAAQISSDGKEHFVSGTGVSAITRDEWKVVAHEIGHGFGAIHDCTADDCPCVGEDCQCCQLSSNQCDSSGYLMSALSNRSAETFSPCSVNTICNAFPGIGSCLVDANDKLHQVYQLNSCGNGIQEEGEECDTNGVDTACCDATTCKLKPTAVCEDSNQSCCQSCQIKPKNDLCRPASSPCDLEEYCTGNSAECPADAYVRDGAACGSDGYTCASGQCTSRDEQCLSRGSVLNVTQSCMRNNEECRLLCNSPSGDKCLMFSGNFIDGTPCGFGGRCLSGDCQNGGPIGSSMLYLGDHKNVAIPIGIVVFLVISAFALLLFWLGCCPCTGCKEKRPRRSVRAASSASSHYYSHSGSMDLPDYAEFVPTTKFGEQVKHSLDFMTPPPYTSISTDQQQHQTKEKRNLNDSTSPCPSSSSSSSSLAAIVNTEDTTKTEKNE